jgi:hypothetical protein
MKNSDQGSRWVPRGRLRTAAVTLALTGIPAVLGAGPARAADTASPASATAASPMIVSRILANHVLTAELVLLVLANVALVLAYGRYRRSTGDRRDAQAAAAPDAMIADPWMTPPPAPPRPAAPPPAPPRPAAGRSRATTKAGASAGAGRPGHVDDYPSWPGRPGPYALHPDHPSWPGRPDPRWAATEAALRAEDHPRWPGRQAPPWRDAERPADLSEPGWPGPAGPGSR